MFPVAMPPQSGRFPLVPDPLCRHFIGCLLLGRGEAASPGSQPRIPQGCVRRSCSAPGSRRERPPRRALRLCRPRSSSPAQSWPSAHHLRSNRSFGRPSPAKPSHHQYFHGHLSGSRTEEGRSPGHARELCLCRFPRLHARCVKMFRLLLNRPPPPKKKNHTGRRVQWISWLVPKNAGVKCTGRQSTSE